MAIEHTGMLLAVSSPFFLLNLFYYQWMQAVQLIYTFLSLLSNIHSLVQCLAIFRFLNIPGLICDLKWCKLLVLPLPFDKNFISVCRLC